MSMGNELIFLDMGNGNRFSLDIIENETIEGQRVYRLNWRGTTTSVDGFINRPAHFNFAMLGEIIGRAIRDRVIGRDEAIVFFDSLITQTRNRI
jgi:hypothetical protein